MTFGDWELFKVLILSLREQQLVLTENEDVKTKFHSNVQQQNFASHDRKGDYAVVYCLINVNRKIKYAPCILDATLSGCPISVARGIPRGTRRIYV